MPPRRVSYADASTQLRKLIKKRKVVNNGVGADGLRSRRVVVSFKDAEVDYLSDAELLFFRIDLAW